jgi:hypothetical protein
MYSLYCFSSKHFEVISRLFILCSSGTARLLAVDPGTKPRHFGDVMLAGFPHDNNKEIHFRSRRFIAIVGLVNGDAIWQMLQKTITPLASVTSLTESNKGIQLHCYRYRPGKPLIFIADEIELHPVNLGGMERLREAIIYYE